MHTQGDINQLIQSLSMDILSRVIRL